MGRFPPQVTQEAIDLVEANFAFDELPDAIDGFPQGHFFLSPK
jgi:hypothetical protein